MSLRDELRRWGQARNARYDRADRGYHALSRAQDFAPGTRERAEKQLIGRNGISRRRLMGESAGRITKGGAVIPVPVWACDPVPASKDDSGIMWASTRPSEQDEKPLSWVDPMPDELHWIDQALSQLARINLVRMMVLREEFCGTGTQIMKAARVAEEYGGSLTVWQYRTELTKALVFLEAKGA